MRPDAFQARQTEDGLTDRHTDTHIHPCTQTYISSSLVFNSHTHQHRSPPSITVFILKMHENSRSLPDMLGYSLSHSLPFLTNHSYYYINMRWTAAYICKTPIVSNTVLALTGIAYAWEKADKTTPLHKQISFNSIFIHPNNTQICFQISKDTMSPAYVRPGAF